MTTEAQAGQLGTTGSCVPSFHDFQSAWVESFSFDHRKKKNHYFLIQYLLSYDQNKTMKSMSKTNIQFD